MEDTYWGGMMMRRAQLCQLELEFPAIGIDLGTTYSCVAVWQHNRVEIIANDQDVKRLIGRRASDETIQEDMSYGLLCKMKGIAETYLGSFVETAVITVRAYFNDSQRQSTKDAATVAGLEVIRMINEPTAAAIAYAVDKRAGVDGKMNVLVFDLGGGTFDVSILTIDEKGTIEVKATGGDTHLGGEDFDNRMVNYYFQEFIRKYKQDISNNQKALGRLRVHCERAKRIVSTASQTMIDIDCLFNGVNFSTKSCLTEKRLCQQLNPDEAVAHGSGIFAANLSGIGNKAMQSLVLIDVTPLSLGVGKVGDVTRVLIPRNSLIPSKKETELYTIKDNKTSMRLPVYQGERSKASQNYLLGVLTLHGLPLAPRREVKVNVSYEIDINGILNVSARETTTGTKNTIKITNTGNLSKAEIDKMIKDAENYKIDDKAYMNKASAHTCFEVYVCKLRSRIKDNNVRLRLTENGLSTRGLNDIEHEIEKALKWLDENPNAEIDELNNRRILEGKSVIVRRGVFNLRSCNPLPTIRMVLIISSVIRMLRHKMKGIAETYLGSFVETAVITVPAYFNDSQRQSTKDAAKTVMQDLTVIRYKDKNVRLRLTENGLSTRGLNDIEHEIEKALKWLDENPNAEIDELNNRVKELENSCKRIKREH
ncbi:putative mediator of RNA polymerase II transcription subunit 37c [Tanacetum coccineum]